MNEFDVSDKDFNIHVLNDLPKEYDVILDLIENLLTLSGINTLTTEVIKEKLNDRYKKIK